MLSLSEHRRISMEKQRENGADMEREEEALTRSLVRETLAEPAKSARLWRLARELRRAMRTLRRSYRRAVQCGKTAADEWLGDNYHLLLREGEGALSALRRRGAGDLPAVPPDA